jgi:hypothetical protein
VDVDALAAEFAHRKLAQAHDWQRAGLNDSMLEGMYFAQAKEVLTTLEDQFQIPETAS